MLFFLHSLIVACLCFKDVQPNKRAIKDDNLPTFYDFLNEYPQCDFGPMQQRCGSCYAYAALKVISHRFCRKTGKKLELSPQYTVACDVTNNGCIGGSERNVYYFLEQHGVPDVQCHPWTNQMEYSPSFCGKCQNNKRMKLYKAKYGSTKHIVGVDKMKKEIFNHGPLSICVVCDRAFKEYQGGVYQATFRESLEAGNHSLELIGWGEENGVPYWIAYNNYGRKWGIDGRIKVKMGSNEGLIESFVYRAEPDLPDSSDNNGGSNDL